MNQKEMTLSKQNILLPQGRYPHRDPQEKFVQGLGEALTKPKRTTAVLEPKAVVAKVLGTEIAGRKGKHEQLAKYSPTVLSFQDTPVKPHQANAVS